MSKLSKVRVAILVADGFEESEMTSPREALEKENAKVELVSPMHNKVKSWKNGQWSAEYSIDVELKDANPNNYDALVLPGGVMNPDKLRIIVEAIAFIKKFVTDNKPIAAICHGPWTLINAGGIAGHTVTSWPSIEIDLKNAGATWVDKEVVVSKNLVTSRKPDDLPFFNKAMIELFATKR